MSLANAPLPPQLALRRVGHGHALTDAEVERDYLAVGAEIHELVRGLLPDGWSPEGRRILDFGAGAGRALRHFGPELEAGAELWGCDIDGPSIEWAQRHLAPCTFFRNDDAPPLAVPDGHFDLVFATSVFTHVTRHWADWLIELHRVMRPGGLLVASFLGPTMHEHLLGRPHDERVGMLVVKPGAPWDEEGGPLVFHSRWWLEAHWSPAFELLRIEDSALGGGEAGHGVLLGRRRDRRPSRELLLAPAPGEPREATAAQHNVELLCREVEALRAVGGAPAVDVDGGETPERYDPAAHGGAAFEAAHLTRYRWAATLMSGRRVLDAGCGVGYGTQMLAAAGASEAVGLDLAAEIVERARAGAGEATRFVVGDLLELPLEDGGFDAVVSFEAIEHVAEPERALAEFARVLAPGGLLFVSTPNSEVSEGNNPHHLRELTPSELEQILGDLFAEVRVLRQREWFASVLAEPGAGTAPSGTAASLHRPAVAEGSEDFVVAVASNGPLPEATEATVTLWRPGGPVAAATETVGYQALALALERERALHDEAGRLQESMREAATAYEAALDGARSDAATARAQTAAAIEAAAAAEALLAAVQDSTSWRATAPLRRLKQRSRRS